MRVDFCFKFPVKSQSTLISMLHDGDFLLGPGHVVFCYTPTKWWSAENDERGKSTGGKAGDQTGLKLASDSLICVLRDGRTLSAHNSRPSLRCDYSQAC